MTGAGSQFGVTPAELSAAGGRIMSIADAIHRDVAVLAGAESLGFGRNRSFSAAEQEHTCAQGWEDALTAIGTGIAVAGDNLVLSASTYGAAEQGNTAHMRAV